MPRRVGAKPRYLYGQATSSFRLRVSEAGVLARDWSERVDLGAHRSQNIKRKVRFGTKLMMHRRFVRHPRGYAGYRTVGLWNYDQFNTTVGVLPDNEHDLAATGMERVVNPPLDQVLAGSMSLLRAEPG